MIYKIAMNYKNRSVTIAEKPPHGSFSASFTA
jgi:hypothetical protein